MSCSLFIKAVQYTVSTLLNVYLSDKVLLVTEVSSSVVAVSSEKTLSEHVEVMCSPTENSSFNIGPV